MARSPEAHAARRLRPRNRQGFVLDNGARIRRKGRKRASMISLEQAAANAAKLVQGIKESYIKVSFDGDGRRPVPVKMLEGLVGAKNPREAWKKLLAAERVSADQAAKTAEAEAALARVKIWKARVEVAKADVEAAEKAAYMAGEACNDLMKEAETAIKNDKAALEAAHELMEQGEKEAAEALDAEQAKAREAVEHTLITSLEGVAAADTKDALAESVKAYEGMLAGHGTDDSWSDIWRTKLDETVSTRSTELEATLTPPGDGTEDKSEGGSTEGGDTEGKSEEGLDEEELLAMKRDQLNKISPEYGVKDPEQYRTKAELVEAILSAGEGG